MFTAKLPSTDEDQSSRQSLNVIVMTSPYDGTPSLSRSSIVIVTEPPNGQSMVIE